MEFKTGKVTIPVIRDGETAGNVTFNPKSAEFTDAFYSLARAFEGKLKDFETRAKALDADQGVSLLGLPNNGKEGTQFILEVCKFMRGELDKVFGAGTSDMVFGDYNSLDMFGQFFEEIVPYINEARKGIVNKYIGGNK